MTDTDHTTIDAQLTIARQMGGIGRLQAMLGATVLRTDRGLAIRWPSKQRAKGNYVSIVLNDQDTYDMVFSSVAGAKVKTVATYSGIYADGLVDAFERQTGYRIKL